MDRTKLFDTFFSELKDSQSLSLYDCAAINGAEPKHENVVKDILDEMLRNKWVVDHGNGKVSLTSIGEEIVNKHVSYSAFLEAQSNSKDTTPSKEKNMSMELKVVMVIGAFTILGITYEIIIDQLERYEEDSLPAQIEKDSEPNFSIRDTVTTKAPK